LVFLLIELKQSLRELVKEAVAVETLKVVAVTEAVVQALAVDTEEASQVLVAALAAEVVNVEHVMVAAVDTVETALLQVQEDAQVLAQAEAETNLLVCSTFSIKLQISFGV
jgi:hypothetical protein